MRAARAGDPGAESSGGGLAFKRTVVMEPEIGRRSITFTLCSRPFTSSSPTTLMSGVIGHTAGSPFASKLGTNYCPTPDDTIEIKALLREPLLQMKRLDTKIAELQQALNKLIGERESLKTHVQAYKALLSPVRRMPADIMQEIFLMCLPTHRNCVMDARETPLLLGRICGAWRTLSLGTPRLWANLHIVDRGEPPRQEGSEPASDSEYAPWPMALQEPRAALVADAVRAWLERAGRCPLSISMQYDLEFGHSPSQSIAQTIFSLASRWQHIRFAATAPAFQELVQLNAADVPELQSVALQCHEVGWDSPGFAWNSLSFLAGAKVQTVAVSGTGLVVPQLPLEWTRLTTLSNLPDRYFAGMRRDSRVTVDAALLTMSRCPRLHSLSFELTTLPVAGELDFVDHHRLQSLHLTGDGQTSASLLDRISVPQLKDFTLRTDWIDPWGNPHAGGHRDSFPEPSLVRFLATLPLLKSLSLTTGPIGSSSLKKILHHLPHSLQHLHINADKGHASRYYAASQGDFLASLAMMPGSTIALPILRDFDIAIAGEELIADDTLLQFITARASTLKRVKINFPRRMEFDIRDALSPLIENGFDFSVTYSPPKIHKYSPWTGLPDAPEIV
ncbi:hypothetical protein FB45DRAFT_470177 [Roridomyces roridus]|uniref:F-box domain-containing protein n=1 Tax=Roridomyces roridus TaxID=1738132 RepID=A0AAD7FNS7_9AGAR|nr:hypothetical protein FB45DRAFT_470177 [Roridomyces roridus]